MTPLAVWPSIQLLTLLFSQLFNVGKLLQLCPAILFQLSSTKYFVAVSSLELTPVLVLYRVAIRELAIDLFAMGLQEIPVISTPYLIPSPPVGIRCIIIIILNLYSCHITVATDIRLSRTICAASIMTANFRLYLQWCQHKDMPP